MTRHILHATSTRLASLMFPQFLRSAALVSSLPHYLIFLYS